MCYLSFISYFFFFNDTATTEIYTLSLHDALPISAFSAQMRPPCASTMVLAMERPRPSPFSFVRSEEHTSELQSRVDLVCRLLLEKKKGRTLQWLPQRIRTEARGTDARGRRVRGGA